MKCKLIQLFLKHFPFGAAILSHSKKDWLPNTCCAAHEFLELIRL